MRGCRANDVVSQVLRLLVAVVEPRYGGRPAVRARSRALLHHDRCDRCRALQSRRVIGVVVARAGGGIHEAGLLQGGSVRASRSVATRRRARQGAEVSR